ncbi:FecR family protein [Pedobacter sandarakinus]|uniref:FecR family protein n=1 Tax=Pedobacter sandarakinus TaxID=353156 RepID=UPI002246FF72|nr:FecR family protein [Pedobacter sandarakinus]MCX2573385.1 FecR family protein [Pedobacter sandarakinus]
MRKEEVEKLLEKYRDGLCTEQEKSMLESWHLAELSKTKSNINHDELNEAKTQIWNAIEEETEIKPKRILGNWIKIAAAAVVVIVLGIVVKNQLNKATKDIYVLAKRSQAPILPGGNRATLTLNDGRKISLTDASNGIIAKQAGISITKTKNGEIIYAINKIAANSSAQDIYNTIETPRGGQYQINLPDGTRVWLNAASKLKYPAVFSLKERNVELQGEAYFEVAKAYNKLGNRIPFKVKSVLNSRTQEVEVLGTHFNINAYQNEQTNKTTLLEGSVKIKNLKSSYASLLKPGQQSIIDNNTSTALVHEVDAAETIAWKDGYFSFNDENLEAIMNKIARWYNVDVDYRGKKVNKTFGGRISRFNSVNEVLDMLQTTGAVHFKIDERRILVMP